MGNKYAGTWTEARIDTVCARWAEGHTATMIGQEIGVTRNAVLGKIDRLGLPKRTTHHVADTQRAVRKRPVRVGVANIIKQSSPPISKPVLVFDSTHVLPFMETRGLQCRFIVSGEGERPHLACGSRTTSETSSYCGYHHAICHRPLYGDTATEVDKISRTLLLGGFRPVRASG